MAGTMKELSKSFDFLIEENRRYTFEKWVFRDNDACNADKMAEAGFVFIGTKAEPDAVKCFLCNKALDGWEATDDPWQEHLKHAPNCYFAQIQKPQDLQTLNQILDMVLILNKNIIEAKKVEIERKFDEYEQLVLAKLEKLKKK